MMYYKKIIGYRNTHDYNSKGISIFLMSFVYPASTGYLKRMDLLITWANERFKIVNLIIPNSCNNIAQAVIDEHLKRCNNLFLLDNKQVKNQKLFSIEKILNKIRTGRYPEFNSRFVLNESLAISFQKVLTENKTDFFLNTRNNFSGLIDFLPSGVKAIFDTQDVYSEMYKKYSLLGKNNYIKKLMCGYREKNFFFKSEEVSLCKYDKIIAISNDDYNHYFTVDSLKNKIYKIDSIGFVPKANATATLLKKEYDLLIVASDFIATQKGIEWMFNEVAPHFTMPVNLCIVGSISNYVIHKRLFNKNINVHIKGIVDSVDNYYQKSRIVSLCMIEGTGTSVKGLEALAHGAAIVTTGAGIRFGGLISGEHCLVTDIPEKFAESIELLLKDTQIRNQLGINALEYAKKVSSVGSTYKQLDAVFDL